MIGGATCSMTSAPGNAYETLGRKLYAGRSLANSISVAFAFRSIRDLAAPSLLLASRTAGGAPPVRDPDDGEIGAPVSCASAPTAESPASASPAPASNGIANTFPQCLHFTFLPAIVAGAL